MSTQINQYLMWGIKMPYEWQEDFKDDDGAVDFSERFEEFMDDSAFSDDVKHKDGIFCLFDGTDGKYIILGRVLMKAKDGSLLASGNPITMPELTDLEKEFIRISVHRNFGVTGEFNYWFVTHYR